MADIGAGLGYYTVRVMRRLGPGGRIYYEFLYRLRPSLASGARVRIMDLDRPTLQHGTPPALLRCELTAVGYRRLDFTWVTQAEGYLAIFASRHPAVARRYHALSAVAIRENRHRRLLHCRRGGRKGHEREARWRWLALGDGPSITETFIGVTLIGGLFTRLGALVALGMAANITVGILSVPHEWGATFTMLIMLAAVVLLTGADKEVPGGRPSGEVGHDRERAYVACAPRLRVTGRSADTPARPCG